MPNEAVKELIERAARAHSNLNIFAAVAALLEGGVIYPLYPSGSASSAAQRIVRICNAEGQKQLRIYDAAIAQAKESQ
jgi:hypothetical protein